MVTASRMQTMVQICKKNAYISTELFFSSSFLLLGLSASKAPGEGPSVVKIGRTKCSIPFVRRTDEGPRLVLQCGVESRVVLKDSAFKL